jgi:hypothetical protein
VITLDQLGIVGLQRMLTEEVGSSGRKIEAAQRLLIDLEQHADLIRAEIKKHYKVASAVAAISKHVDTRHNVLKRVADRLATPAYEVPPFREWRDLSKEAAKRWAEALRDEGQIETDAEKWTRYAFICNVVHLLPMVIDGELRFETVLPHAADVLFDRGDRDPSILVYECGGDGFDRVAVDAERYWYINDHWEIIDEFEHGYRDHRGRPLRPWVEWRISPRPDGDYWDRGRGRILVDATLAAGRVSAHMEWIRQTNAGKLSTLIVDDLDDIPPEQAVTPERPLVLTDAQAQFEVHDLIVPITEFAKHIDKIDEDVAEHYGIRARAINQTTADGQTSDLTPQDQADLSKFRRNMIKHLRRSESDLQFKTAVVAKRASHPAAPDPEAARTGFRCGFPPLTFVDHPKAQLETDELAMSLGQTDHVRMYMQRNPGADEAEAEENLEKSIERRNKFAGMLSARNLPADAGQDGDSLAQLQGRLGGVTAAKKAPEGDGEEDGKRSTRRAG